MRRILLLAGIWGWSFLLIKVSVRGITPPTIACLRCALGGAALLVLCRVRGLRLPRDRKTVGHMVVMGLLYGALPFTLLGWGEERTTSALASVAQADAPLFTALFTAWLLGERLRRPQAIGLVIGLIGVGVCAGIAVGDLLHSSTIGALAEATSGASYGLAFTYVRRHLHAIDPLVAATGQVIAGSLLALPLAVGTTVTSGLHLTPTRTVAILILGIVSTGIAYAINYASIAAVGPTRASMVTYIIPAVAITVGAVVLGEPFQVRVIIGGVLIAAGIALVQGRFGGVRRIPIVGALLAALVLGACSASTNRADTSAPQAGCAAAHHDQFDPRSTIHILPNAPTPSFLTNPPTSGEHQPVNVTSFRGVQTAPIRPAIQVALLESGEVVVQYRSPADLQTLTALVDHPLVTLAPNPSLPDPVDASAWTWHIRCGPADAKVVRSIRAFVAAHGGKGPQAPPP